MGDETRKKEVKQIVYVLAFIWVLNIVMWGYSFYSGTISFQITSIIDFSPLVLIAFVMAGLWSFKKWALILGYILSVIFIIKSTISLSIFGILIWWIVLYYLYKHRNIFY